MTCKSPFTLPALAGLLALLGAACSGDEASNAGLGGAGGEQAGDASPGGTGSTGGNGAGGDDGETETHPGGPAWPGGPALPPVTGVARTGKVDVLLVVDNSQSMADKQAALRSTIGDMVEKITASGSGVDDVHVGVITSSLGGVGAVLCEPLAGKSELRAEMENDRAHLVGSRPRAAASGATVEVATWTRGTPAAALVSSIEAMVLASGEQGCGFESTLEAAYRFLADPAPPEVIQLAPCEEFPSAQCAMRTGTDPVLLSQRAAFLRPDSAVALVLLSDENDCSTRDTGQFYFSRSPQVTLGASSACAGDPNAACCYSCLVTPPEGCSPDPVCARVPGELDAINLRCFDQARRFGIDFLQPVQRYVNAFTQPWLCTSRADLSMAACGDPQDPAESDVVTYEPTYEKNPLFQSDGGNRAASLVYFLGIVGVPGGEVSATGTVTWERVLGTTGVSAGQRVPPTNRLMVESIAPRTGSGVGTQPLMPPEAVYLANAENGHEYTNASLDSLQFACIFHLPSPVDCARYDSLPASDSPACDCSEAAIVDLNPLCQAEDGSYGRMQRFAKAYPGSRHLEVVRSLGQNGAVGSICARNLTDPSLPTFGYRQPISALIERLSRSVR